MPRPLLLAMATLAMLLDTPVLAQVSPAKSEAQLKTPDGLEATLWASEPMVNNPTNMDIDSRGRVWITEGLNYRLTRRGNAQFKRGDNADKLKILEDTDGDGKADKVIVFADNIFPVPMGLAVEEHYGPDGKYKGAKVFIGNSPDILVLEDTDGDDKADKRYPLLTGFGGIDSDHGVHGMVLGLDGKLYFTHGDGCCSVQQDHTEKPQNFDVLDKSGRHVSSSRLANTLRVNRDGTQFEILADRQRNNYETSLNSFGNIFTSDNDDDGNRGSRVIWIMDGGEYGYRTPGSAHHWGEEVPGNVPKLVGTGNGSPCGIMVYEGKLLPGAYFGSVLEADAGSRQINFMPITRKGASFRSEYKVLLASDDPWFRPVDMTAAPDGSVFVADWYDSGVGGHTFRDQDTGRIYRVAPKGVKSVKVTYDFATTGGLINALASPVVSARDAARRSLIEKAKTSGKEVTDSLRSVLSKGEPIQKARALWVLVGIEGDGAAVEALRNEDPRLRELGVRILGRDVSRTGSVEVKDPTILKPIAATRFLNDLLPLAGDKDAGVRRELILALRDLPTAMVGPALKTLAAAWDGQDRWYLEALGLAVQNREPAFIASLFDGGLYGDLGLARNGEDGKVALPPYFPVDRNEAYIVDGTPDLPANALTKTLGLAWRLRRVESLSLLSKIQPGLKAPELQQAFDDVLAQMKDKAAAVVLAKLALDSPDLTRRQELFETLAKRLAGEWRGARGDAKVVEAIQSSLGTPELRLQGIALASSTGDARYAPAILAFAKRETTPEEIRVAAIDALSVLDSVKTRPYLDELIEASRGKASTPIAVAAVRALPRYADGEKLLSLIDTAAFPLGIRREALRAYSTFRDGGMKVIDLAKAGKLPADLKSEAMSIVHHYPNNSMVRNEALKVLPLPKTANGRSLPPAGELIRRPGYADKGKLVFHRTAANACATCHRVQGQGNWIGPDLSTIGTKYGKDELLQSILYPSKAIGYNFRATIIATGDGRVLTGLPIEETADRVVLKTAEGERVTIPVKEIEERKISEISLMPEGLAQTMSDQELVDLLAFLTTLKQPVSVVGQYQAVGPVNSGAVNPSAPVAGQNLSWRRLDANAESLVNLGTVAGDDDGKSAYLHIPVVSPADLPARLVLDTKSKVKAWLNGAPLELPESSGSTTLSSGITLKKGNNDLLIEVPGGGTPSLATTIVADKPLEFRSGR